MPLVYNPLPTEVKVKAFGAWFSFKPGQIKSIGDEFAHFLVVDKKETGLVGLPEEYLEDQKSAEMVKLKTEATKSGYSNRIRFLEGIAHNLRVSLRMDLEKANIKAAPEIFASDGEIAALEELDSLKKTSHNEEKARAEKVKGLFENLDKKEVKI